MAGGGSVLTISALIFSGLDANLANGTNRVGIFVETSTAFLTYKKENVYLGRRALFLALSALPGAILGAIYAVNIEDALFKKIFVGVIIFVAFTLFKGRKSLGDRPLSDTPAVSWYAYPAMFLVGFYGGFVQAGVGLLIFSVLKSTTTASLVQISAIKTVIVFLYTVPALLIFVYAAQVAWLEAVVLASGYLIGARVSAKAAVKKGDKLVKRVLAAALVLIAIRLFTL